eukprot:COSAG01_NODE_2760_length_7120_cov_49.854253_14_plen_93_part_00
MDGWVTEVAPGFACCFFFIEPTFSHRPAGLVVETYTRLRSSQLRARSHTGSCLLGQISGSGPQGAVSASGPAGQILCEIAPRGPDASIWPRG